MELLLTVTGEDRTEAPACGDNGTAVHVARAARLGVTSVSTVSGGEGATGCGSGADGDGEESKSCERGTHFGERV